jgi:hypothetical protein
MSAPSFDAPWRELASDWLPEDVPSYVSAGAFATHLVRLLEADKIDEFPAVFSAIERLLVEGDPGIRYVVLGGCWKTSATLRRTDKDGRSRGAFASGSVLFRRPHGTKSTGGGAPAATTHQRETFRDAD